MMDSVDALHVNRQVVIHPRILFYVPKLRHRQIGFVAYDIQVNQSALIQ